jgi:hypothetical protein
MRKISRKARKGKEVYPNMWKTNEKNKIKHEVFWGNACACSRRKIICLAFSPAAQDLSDRVQGRVGFFP